MLKYEFTLPITPKAKQRARILKTGRSYTPKETVEFENTIRGLSRKYAPIYLIEGPVALSMEFVVKRPIKPRHKIHPITRPDLDNYIKAVKDAFNGIFWRDDSQVVILMGKKSYGEPKILIAIEEILNHKSIISERTKVLA